jgi:serine/threonine protein kinase
VQDIDNSLTGGINEPHLIMEYAKYGTLHSLCLYTKTFSEQLAFVVISQVAKALKACHDKEILHLDLKEQNILIAYQHDNQFRPECAGTPVAFKLADFGISQDLTKATSQQLLTSNIVYNRGTLSYLAPEQGVRGAKLHDVYRVEVFQLGVILFRLLFKHSPFKPSSFEDPMARDPEFLDKFIQSD